MEEIDDFGAEKNSFLLVEKEMNRWVKLEEEYERFVDGLVVLTNGSFPPFIFFS